MVARNVRRGWTVFAIVIGVIGLSVVTAPGLGAATPTYELVARDSGALPGRVFSTAAGAPDGESVVVYGGEKPGEDPDKMLADTWVYELATGWVAKCGATIPGADAPCGPGPRSGGALASGSTGVVLFGGSEIGLDDGSGSAATDTWVWNGTAWTQVCAPGTCGPTGRMFPAMAGNGENVVLFGGLTETGAIDDTWVFDGSTWTQTCGTGQPLACGPTALVGAAIAWDGNQFVMFGGSPMGSSGLSDPVDDTWIFDGAKWEQVCGASMSNPCGPGARSLAGFAFQRQATASLQGAVLFGGGNLFAESGQVLLRDAWFWRAGSWTQLATPWPATPVTFAEDGPPAGSGPLLPLVATQPSLCQVLFVGEDPVASSVGVAPQTFSVGWDLSGTGQPPGCNAQPAENTGTTPAAVPVAASAEASPAPAASGSIARTGRGSDRLAVIGALAVVVGLGAIVATRPRRDATAADLPG